MGKEKRSGEICGVYGGRVSDATSIYMDEGSMDHRITIISKYRRVSREILKVSSEMPSENSWVAVKGSNSICIVTRLGIAREKLDFPNCFQDFFVFGKPLAVVSMCVGIKDGSGIAASFAVFNEIVAINFLKKVSESRYALTDAKAMQVAISALRYLCHEPFLKASDIEVYVLKDGDDTPRSLLSNEFKACLNVNTEEFEIGKRSGQSQRGSESESSDSKTPDDARMTCVPASRVGVGCGSIGEFSEKGKIRYNREAHICCGGWDSRLLKSCGFSWITVLGKDSICVVIQDVITRGEGIFDNVLSHVEDNQLFGFKGCINKSVKKSSMIRPFAAVSVVVGHDESGHHRGSCVIFVPHLCHNVGLHCWWGHELVRA